MTQVDDETRQILQLCAPQVFEPIERLRKSGQRLVHYTSAEAAINIIQSRAVWMRSSSIMNDFMEIEHGLQCLAAAWRSEQGTVFRAFLDGMKPGLSERIAVSHDSEQNALKYGTYLLAVSEHRDSEDRLGRLSMWRAYGGSNGVALVLNNNAFVSESNALAAFTVPVTYQSEPQFIDWFGRWTASLQKISALLVTKSDDEVLAYFQFAFRLFALSTKHPGFHEEQEWRIIYSAQIEETTRLIRRPVVIRGMPQIIYEIPLANIPEENFIGAELNELVNHIIVGPSESPWTTKEALVDILREAGLEDAESKVFVSNIPLRQ